MRTSALSSTISVFCLGLLAGCTGDSPKPSDSTAISDPAASEEIAPIQEVEVVPDDSDAIAALEAVGAQLKVNGKGQAVEVSLRETEATDDALQHIAKLTMVRSLFC